MSERAIGGQPIGILGGTFDPVHNGHLRMAIEVCETLGLAEVRLVPSARPPHREAPTASPGQRAKWIRVAVSEEPELRLDDRELLRSGPSYTVDTLASLRAEFPRNPLCLIMGQDVFANLVDWHQWQRLFEYAHIVLIERPDVDGQLPEAARAILEERKTTDPAALSAAMSGHVLTCSPPPLAISGTRVRALLAAGRSPRFLLPDSVLDDIVDTGTYKEPRAPHDP